MHKLILKKIGQFTLLILVVTCDNLSFIEDKYYNRDIDAVLINTLNKIEIIDNYIDQDFIYLPTVIDEIDIEWFNSSNTDILTNFGQINRPQLSEGEKSVTIEAKCSYGSYSAIREFEFIIKPDGKGIEEFFVFNESFRMIYIEPGVFKRINYILTEPFYISEYEISSALFNKVMDIEGGDDTPMTMVSWNQAIEFSKKLSAITGRKFTLPTEAQWVYCAAAANDYIYSGSTLITDVADFNQVIAVGDKTLLPNSFGIYHMSGNVYEWTLDAFGYFPADKENPINKAYPGDEIVIKGGSFKSKVDNCNIYSRSYTTSDTFKEDLGIRLIMSY